MTNVYNMEWWEREKLLTPKDKEAVVRANHSCWEDIDEGWAETEAGRYEIHRIMTRKMHNDEYEVGIL